MTPAEKRLAAIRRERARAKPEPTVQPFTLGGVVPKLPTLDYYDRHAGERR